MRHWCTVDGISKRARCLWILGVFVALLSSWVGAENAKPSVDADGVPIVLNVPTNDPQDYYFQLLKKAMETAANGRELPVFQQAAPMAQGRAAYELLRSNLVDVFWMGTDDVRESHLLHIPIPLDRGLLGFRRFIIHRDMVSAFDKVKNLEDLKKLLACQGRDWPDAKIMRNAGLRVTEANSAEKLYQQVVARRCDYFPCGFLEAELEMKAIASVYPDLTYYNQLLLYYPFTQYYFVNPKNVDLAKWIHDELEMMIESGQFARYMKEHPYTSDIFSPSELQSVDRLIRIDNAMMLHSTHYKDARYWFQPEDFIPAE